MITIVARGSAQADRVENLADLARDLVKASRSEAGNVSYDFYATSRTPRSSRSSRSGNDQAAIDLHNASPHFRGFVERAAPLFAGPLDIALYRKLT